MERKTNRFSIRVEASKGTEVTLRRAGNERRYSVRPEPRELLLSRELPLRNVDNDDENDGPIVVIHSRQPINLDRKLWGRRRRIMKLPGGVVDFDKLVAAIDSARAAKEPLTIRLTRRGRLTPRGGRWRQETTG